jgi:tetratricopeptide (TPR) repeat protein
MLETIREFALDRLRSSGDEAETRRRHAEYVVDFAESAAPQLTEPRQAEWLRRLEMEHDNIRAALQWSIDTGTIEIGLRIGGSIWRFWRVRSHVAEGRRWLADLLSRSDGIDGATRAQALQGAGALAAAQGDYAEGIERHIEALNIWHALQDRRGESDALNFLGIIAQAQVDYETAAEYFNQSLAIQRELGDQRSLSSILNNLGAVAHDSGDFDRATGLYEEALAIRRKIGDRPGEAIPLLNLGNLAVQRGDYAAAIPLFAESLALAREVQDEASIAVTLDWMGKVAYDQGDYARALALYQESLRLHRALKDKGNTASCLEGLAAVLIAMGRSETAARAFGASDALRESIGAPVPPSERDDYDAAIAALKQALSPETLAWEWGQGRGMTLEQIAADIGQSVENRSDWPASSG